MGNEIRSPAGVTMPHRRTLKLLTLKLFLFAAIFLGPSLSLSADEKTTVPDSHPEVMVGTSSAAVVVDGNQLFRLLGISSFPAQERAQAIARHIRDLAADPAVSPESLTLMEAHDMTRLVAGDVVVLNLVDADAELEGVELEVLAKAVRTRIVQAIVDWRTDRDPAVLKRNALFALGVTVVFTLALLVGHWGYRRLKAKLEKSAQELIQDVTIKQFKLFDRNQLLKVVTRLVGLIWYSIILASAYFYLQSVLSLFPWTRGLANWLIGILIAPVKTLGLGLIKAFPDLVFLVVLYFVARFILRMIHLFFAGVAEGKVVLGGFDAEWAWPTYRLVRMLLIGFSLVVAYPYIPGSDSAAFKGVSIFAGVLFSLGSSSLVGNLIAGYTMTYRRAFRIGDRIRVGEHLGDVEQIRLLVTHLRTPKNEAVIVPNSSILNAEVINYSSLAKEHGLILHSTVGIGYDTPWRQVEALLLKAAERTSGVLNNPSPFVLQKALGDFTINYEINVYCAEPRLMNRVLSDLHGNIQDTFNEYGVQIMSPNYEADPETPKIVPRENWYATPAQPPEG